MWSMTPRPNKCKGYKYPCGRNALEGLTHCHAHIEYFKKEGLIKMTTPVQEPLRMSASYVKRYNNCHGSANLTEAIEGFEYPARNEDGMKGEGTRLHKIFELALEKPERLRDSAALLREIADIWGPHRTKYLEQEAKTYLISYFLKHKAEPPLEIEDLKEALLQYVPVLDEDSNPKKNEDGTVTLVAKGVAPRRIIHLAESLEYVADLIDTIEPDTLVVHSEVKKEASWLSTEPYTTVDLIVSGTLKSTGESVMHVVDLKMGDVPVPVIMNEQLMYYAKTFGAEDYAVVTLHILQRNGTDHWDLPPAVLDAWVQKVQQSEREILAGDLTLTAGSHCQFCPANPHGRGDRGSKACPVMMEVLYGARDKAKADSEVTEEEWEDE
ncbi:Cas4 family exonuclease [Microbacterium phage Wesak]|uniref:Cas4 family exonuclease n=1 Tax=Microbacterium phage Wesak TaxID=2653751 RepID=A0A5Q2WLU0_9CAUD|nr:Cas4 family exonuclease [Microbacterium phage Wesak]